MICVILLLVAIIFISNIYAGCPSECICSTLVANCSDRDLNEIPQNISETVTELILRNNNISQVDFGENHLYYLETLDLRKNSIEAFSRKALDGVPLLKILKLDNNKLSEVSRSRNFFGNGDISLIRVSLSRNRFFSTLYQTLFYHMTAVTYIDVSHNSFSLIPGNAFPRSLQHLDLSYNRFIQFHPQTFVNLRQLTYLDLRGLEMRSIQSDLFENLQSLEVLRLGGRSLISIESNLLNGLYSLNTLELVDSSFSTLPTDLLQFSQDLRNLDLSNNQLDILHQDFFADVTLLRALNLTGNNINSLALITNVLSSLNLKELVLNSMTLLGSLSDLLHQQDELEILSFAQNNLSVLNSEISSSSLKSLNLAYNNLVTLSTDAFVNCAALQSLNLTGNQFSSLPQLRTSSKIKVYISGNVWNCSCDLYNAFSTFISNVSKSNIRFSCHGGLLPDNSLSCLLCDYPQRFAGMYIGNLHNEFRICQATNEFTSSIGIELTQTQQFQVAPNINVTAVVVPIAVIIFLALGIALLCYVKRSRTQKVFDTSTSDTGAGIQITDCPTSHIYEPIHFTNTEVIGSCNLATLPVDEKHYAKANDYSVYSKAVDPSKKSYEFVQHSSNYTFAGDGRYKPNNSLVEPSIKTQGPSAEGEYLSPMFLQSASLYSKINTECGNDSNNLNQNLYVLMK